MKYKILVIVCLLLFTLGCTTKKDLSSMTECEIMEEEKMKSYYGIKCCKACERLEYPYLDHKWGSSGWGRQGYYMCYCIKEGEPIQII